MVIRLLALALLLMFAQQMETLARVLMEMRFGFHGVQLSAVPESVAEYSLGRISIMLMM
jgi:hypothetical protein